MSALNNPNKIIVHHFGGTNEDPLADSSNLTTQDVDGWHKARWKGFTTKINAFRNNKGELYHVGYHFVIEKDGTVVQCRGILEEGAHTIGQNTRSIGVVLAGNFDVTMPTIQQRNAFVRVYKEIIKTFPDIEITDVFPHRMYANKTCFGWKLSNSWFTYLLDRRKSVVSPEDTDVMKELQHQVVQLLTQLYSLLRNKRFSNKEIN